jgi:WXG100 family type VII secretion target
MEQDQHPHHPPPPPPPLSPENAEMLARAEEKLSRLDPLIAELNTLHGQAQAILDQRDDIPANFSVDPDGLDQIAATFENFAGQLQQATTRLQVQVAALGRAGLSGAAAERIQAELNDLVVPTLQHLQNAMLTWKRQTGQIAFNVRKVSSILEDVAKDVKTVEQVKQLVDNDLIAKTVRERMEDELRKAGKLPDGQRLPPLAMPPTDHPESDPS